MRPRFAMTTLILLSLASHALAEVKLPPVFSDHMVLQADMAVPVFGTAAVDEPVTVEFGGQMKTATAGKDGRWIVKLDALKAGGPFVMKIAGTNAITISDVLVGEVWIAGGQSNMRYPLSKATDGKDDAAKADHPKLRFVLPGGKWQTCTPKTAPAFSAVGYYFAVALAKERKVPVGVIDNSVNGELAQNFVSPEAFTADAELAGMVRQHTKETSSRWDTLVAPLIPYAIRGVLWAQGEGNRDFPVTYRGLLPALITDWRSHWGQGDMPFLVVQLANYQDRREEPWEGKDCALREAQLKAVQATAKTALVVTIDLGIPKDVHFPNKKPVGERLALAARALAYDEKIVFSGPICESAKFDGGKAVVSFNRVGGGLIAKGDGATMTGFVLCGADKKFHRAEAKIEGNTVIVSSVKVPAPVAVRYAWERNPDCNLGNEEGLPASPFRSDSFVSFLTKDGSK